MSDRTTQTRIGSAHKAGDGNNIFRLDEMAAVAAGAGPTVRGIFALCKML